MALERIVITLSKTGTLRGMSAQDWDGMPQPITPADLALLAPSINAALVTEIDDLKTAHAAALAAAQGLPRPTGGVTKLTIKRRLGVKWPILKSLLSQLPAEAQDEWDLAQEIRADDATFAAYSASLQAALELTEAELTALLTP